MSGIVAANPIPSVHYANTIQVDAPQELPLNFPPADANGSIRILLKQHGWAELTIIPELQLALTEFIKSKGDPIASVIVVEVATGNVLAMAQGRAPAEWDARSHTALYSGFPAASLFKTVSTTAALEVAKLQPTQSFQFAGSCQHVSPQGVWLQDAFPRFRPMTLTKAFGQSCNTFFAKIAVQDLGLGLILDYAHKLGWNQTLPTDFKLDRSPIHPPAIRNSSAQNIGSFAAGFGMVGLSVAHAAWINLVIARNGIPAPLRIFRNVVLPSLSELDQRPTQLFGADTAEKLKNIGTETVQRGTARTIFHKPRYKSVVPFVSGKTGTLNGVEPHGATTWFAGIMSYTSPEIVVSSVVVNSEKWTIKGPHLAAEAFYQWNQYRKSHTFQKLSLGPPTTSSNLGTAVK